jgi:hypothetical protein
VRSSSGKIVFALNTWTCPVDLTYKSSGQSGWQKVKPLKGTIPFEDTIVYDVKSLNFAFEITKTASNNCVLVTYIL